MQLDRTQNSRTCRSLLALWGAPVKAIAALPTIAFLCSAGYGAELKCFANPVEARGFYFVKFAVEQGTTAKKCDDTYALWNPPLFSISNQVMASTMGNTDVALKKSLAESADRLTKRLGISSSELFALVAQRTLPFLSASVSISDCKLLARKLQIRLTNSDDLMVYTIAGAAAEERAGHICR